MKDTDLVPELKEWKKRNGDSFSIEEWISFQATPGLMIGFASIFWPKFIEINKGVFLKDGYSEDCFNGWFNQTEGNIGAVQGVMNHRHIGDMFQSEKRCNLSIIQVEYLGRLLVEMWGTKLRKDFPHLNFEIELCDFDGKDVVSPSVSFWVKE